MSIINSIDSNVRCTKCGTKGVGNCDCWTRCNCGWSYEKGGKCRNPIHKKVKVKSKKCVGDKTYLGGFKP